MIKIFITKYELFNNVEDPWDWIKYDLYENKYALWLSRFFTPAMGSVKRKQLHCDKMQQVKITIDYLSDLLRQWKLKMKTFEQSKINDEEGLDWYVINSVSPWKEWWQSDIEEWINYIKEKWLSIKNEREEKLWRLVIYVYTYREWMDDIVSW